LALNGVFPSERSDRNVMSFADVFFNTSWMLLNVLRVSARINSKVPHWIHKVFLLRVNPVGMFSLGISMISRHKRISHVRMTQTLKVIAFFLFVMRADFEWIHGGKVPDSGVWTRLMLIIKPETIVSLGISMESLRVTKTVILLNTIWVILHKDVVVAEFFCSPVPLRIHKFLV